MKLWAYGNQQNRCMKQYSYTVRNGYERFPFYECVCLGFLCVCVRERERERDEYFWWFVQEMIAIIKAEIQN